MSIEQDIDLVFSIRQKVKARLQAVDLRTNVSEDIVARYTHAVMLARVETRLLDLENLRGAS